MSTSSIGPKMEEMEVLEDACSRTFVLEINRVFSKGMPSSDRYCLSSVDAVIERFKIFTEEFSELLSDVKVGTTSCGERILTSGQFSDSYGLVEMKARFENLIAAYFGQVMHGMRESVGPVFNEFMRVAKADSDSGSASDSGSDVTRAIGSPSEEEAYRKRRKDLGVFRRLFNRFR